LDASPSMIYRVREQLVEEGFEAVLNRKPRATSPTPLAARYWPADVLNFPPWILRSANP
jgi:hypothetical protein